MAKKRKAVRRKKQAPQSVGLAARETRESTAATRELSSAVEDEGGAVLASYREPFGGKPVLLVSLPIEAVEPTPYQRDASEPHVKRLMTVIETLGRFLDPMKMTASAGRFNVDRVKPDQVTRAAGPPIEDDEA